MFSIPEQIQQLENELLRLQKLQESIESQLMVLLRESYGSSSLITIARNRNKMTQQYLAERLGYTRSHISNIENHTKYRLGVSLWLSRMFSKELICPVNLLFPISEYNKDESH